MYNYTINLNDALNIASIAPNGTGNLKKLMKFLVLMPMILQ